MNDTLRAEYKAYVDLSWVLDRTALSYTDWLEAKVVALQTTLAPFARFGKLQHRYAPDALFTIAYDRNGKEVAIRYADLVHAAELVPDVETAGQGGEQIGGRGGIAEIMVGDTAIDKPKFTYRVRWISHSDGQERIGQTSAYTEHEAVSRFYAAGVNAALAEVIETTPYGVPFASEEVKP